MERLDRFWVGAATALLLVAIAGAAVFLYRYHDNRPPVFIAPPAATGTTSGEVSIGGAVANPGLYPLRQNDTIAALLEDAGGVTE
ncbi:MAG: SLBB domain-containing protein, partial [Chloroflexota bacterium]